MRIAFHTPRASYLAPGWSGDHVFVRGLLRGLAERGHEVDVVSGADLREVSLGNTPARRLLADAVRARRLRGPRRPDAWLVYGASVAYPDLLGWWQHPRRYVLFAAGAGRAGRVPRRWRRLFRFAHARSLAAADRVVAFRPKSGELLRRAGVPEQRVQVLPLAIRTWDAIPAQAEARRRIGLPPDRPVVLTVTRLSRRRRDGRPWKTEMVAEVVRAMTSTPEDAMLVVVGDGRGRPQLEREVAERGLSGRVRFAGAVEHDELPAYYAAADLFALPDLRDFPWLAVLEAQACGRPVLTTDTRAARLTVDAGRTGVLAADVAEFRRALGELVRDRERCRAIGAAGPAYVRGNHSLDVRIDQIEAMLAGDGSAGP